MLRGFSWKQGINHFSLFKRDLVITPQDNVFPDLPKKTPYMLKPGCPTPG
jgi:hypothetical protein|tara:strand:- start:341 stop:490 length:150 start_codon:yes stop_codon:yes gene_type:complete